MTNNALNGDYYVKHRPYFSQKQQTISLATVRRLSSLRSPSTKANSFSDFGKKLAERSFQSMLVFMSPEMTEGKLRTPCYGLMSVGRLPIATRRSISLMWTSRMVLFWRRAGKFLPVDVRAISSLTPNYSSSVERGNKILPPFDTAVGKVGSAICFDVSHWSLLNTVLRLLTALSSAFQKLAFPWGALEQRSSPTPPLSPSLLVKHTGRYYSELVRLRRNPI